MTKDWIKLLLVGEKKLMPMSSIKPVHVGNFPEVSVKCLYADFSERNELKPYLPDKLPKVK